MKVHFNYGKLGLAAFLGSIAIILVLCLLSKLRPSEKWSPHATTSRPENLRDRNLISALTWAALSQKEKMDHLDENPIYSEFGIRKADFKKSINLLLIVSSAPRRHDRRAAIRETWWTQCQSSDWVSVECVFITDELPTDAPLYSTIAKEQEKYGDMYLQPLHGGIEFGMRYMYHLVWAISNYDFDYVLRVDDDYFLCLERLLYELPLPMVNLFHWGFTHCITGIVRPEESMLLFSRDVVQIFLAQDPHRILCHPWADQMIGAWVNDMGLEKFYRHDARLHHDPPVRDVPEILAKSEICSEFIGVHGAYPENQRDLWKARGSPEKSELASNQCTLENCTTTCDLPHRMKYDLFFETWRYEPTRCILKPVWNTQKQGTKGGSYTGRQEDPTPIKS